MSSRPRPPQEAIDACAGKKIGDSCTFEMDETVIESRCVNAANETDDSLFCAPDPEKRAGPQGEPPHHHGKPQRREPTEAEYSACTGKNVDDACSATSKQGNDEGTCVKPPEGSKDSRLHCMPSKKPDGHGKQPRNPPPGSPPSGN